LAEADQAESYNQIFSFISTHHYIYRFHEANCGKIYHRRPQSSPLGQISLLSESATQNRCLLDYAEAEETSIGQEFPLRFG